MSLVALLLEDLACARRACEPFHSVWPTAVGRALAAVDADELRPWQRALEDTRRRGRRAAVDGCDDIVIPHPRGGVKKFCSKRCTNRADQIRRREVKNARRRERRARLAAAA